MIKYVSEVNPLPFIHVRTNINIDSSTEARREKDFGKVISFLPGKTLDWLRTRIDDGCKRTFAGSKDPLRMIKVSVFGSSSPDDYNRFTGKLTDIVVSYLPIQKDRIYVSYFETPHWGYNGSNF